MLGGRGVPLAIVDRTIYLEDNGMTASSTGLWTATLPSSHPHTRAGDR